MKDCAMKSCSSVGKITTSSEYHTARSVSQPFPAGTSHRNYVVLSRCDVMASYQRHYDLTDVMCPLDYFT